MYEHVWHSIESLHIYCSLKSEYNNRQNKHILRYIVVQEIDMVVQMSTNAHQVGRMETFQKNEH